MNTHLPSSLVHWSFPRKLAKARTHIWRRLVCISLQLQEDQQHKSFTTQVISLNCCDLFLTVLVYMQEQQNCSHKTCHICIEIVSNCSSRISFKDTHREKTPSNKTPAFEKSMNMGIWTLGS